MARSKFWCFTLNNYTEEDESRIQEVFNSRADYGIYGREVGESGTPHLQGYIVFKERRRLPYVKAAVGARAHLEVARGTPADSRRYCSKEGSVYEHGELPVHGPRDSSGRCSRRDELACSFIAAAERGRDGMSEFAAAEPGCYWFSRHTLLRNYGGHRRADNRPGISVKWYYGPPGSGKSRRAHDELPDAYIKEPRTKWWNNYFFEKDCIIDDFGPNGIDINHLLRWFDRYKCYVEVKGDMVALCVERFIVTSNFHPSELFKFGDAVNPQLPALLRRIIIEEIA